MDGTVFGSVVDIAPVKWGRAEIAGWSHTVSSLGLIAGSTGLTLLNLVALEHSQGSLQVALQTGLANPSAFFLTYLPFPSWLEVQIYVMWVAFQAALYMHLPGSRATGQRTPAGHLLSYICNGLTAWAVTHFLFFTATWHGIIDAAIIANHWQGLFAVANCYGFLLAVYAQLKGYFFPTYPKDCKLTGCWAFDFWAGVELNPRIGSFDLKFFHNGRPGIVAWTLIDLSWAAYQRQKFGFVSSAMIVTVILHAIYVVDFFWNEAWYTHTVDISHDHFGFMLSWGDSTFLPTFYTLQTQYLARYPGQE
ncbi:hypothetical protein MY10362_009320, partial [Beauveria mimosiformis]